MPKDNLIIKSYIYAGILTVIIILAANMALAAPQLNILGNYAIVGGTATTSNANFTASGTLQFTSLTGSNDCLTVNSSGVVSTSTCGGSGVSFGAATSTAGINVATTTNTLTLSLRNSLADISGLATTTGNLIVASSTGSSGWETLAVGTDDYVLSASSTANLGIWWRNPPWLTAAITSLNGLTGSTQTFATSTGINITSSGSTHTFNLRQVLQTLSGLATTKGNLILGNSGGTDFTVLGVGSDGKILTASSTATNGVSWEAASGGSGGGTAYQTIYLPLNPAGAATATSSPAGSNKYIGTNWTIHTLDYDGSTKECAFWTHRLPQFTAVNTAQWEFTMVAKTVSTASSTVMGITHRPVGNNEGWDATTGETNATTSLSFTVVDRFYTASTTVATSSLTSQDTFQFEICREPTDSGDAMTSDARYTSGGVFIQYR